MRRMVAISAGLAAILFCAALYIAWPLHTAWSIREAVKSGNSEYLRTTIEWEPVKETLKESLAAMTFGEVVPDSELPMGAPRRSMWERIKAYYGRPMLDGMVESYATPEGLPTLFSYGRTVRRDVLGRQDPDDGLSLPARLAASWSRIDRAGFKSLTRFEIDMRDKFETSRVYAGVLELRPAAWGYRWKLVELRVRQSPLAGTEASGAPLGLTASND